MRAAERPSEAQPAHVPYACRPTLCSRCCRRSYRGLGTAAAPAAPAVPGSRTPSAARRLLASVLLLLRTAARHWSGNPSTSGSMLLRLANPSAMRPRIKACVAVGA